MKPALLIIDMQEQYFNDLVDAQSDLKQAAEYINFYSKIFRAKGLPVINILNQDLRTNFTEGKPNFEFIKEITSETSDYRVLKNYGNAFKKTELDNILKELEVDTLFLTGFAGEYCVHATYFGADALDYSAFYVTSAVAYAHADYEFVISKTVDSIGPKAFYKMLELI